MSEHFDDLVKVAAGTLIQVQELGNVLQGAGIQSRVVGDDLTAGLGTALPDSVELWVRRADATAAESTLAAADGHHKHHAPASHPVPAHGHPVSDPKPDHSRGPTHGASPHRPMS
ncbi:hypothetical protein [Frigoriglobus tundricola]|uniref:DUF2007 domain-containing protein n=1 Tax=Frigoriglobus tundricola TaxID=2774151 RepID=A0A6M5YR27_9BACT|nr:hypothetical protein [Frigoriglobus tundricola]QJW95452.1 hypothetical protein FTUN_3001 [Frigoriglobus tundricola]